MAPRLVLAVLLIFAVFAGCAQKTGLPGVALQDLSPVVANSTVGAPQWKVGDWWDHEWSIYSNGTVAFQFTVRVVVAEDAGDSWTMGADNKTMAAFHGAFGFPTLGKITKADITATTGTTSRWPWYRFPLAMNATWSDTAIHSDDTGTPQADKVAMKVVSTPRGGQGTWGIEMTAKGKLLAKYDYDPQAGWFSDTYIYDGAGNLFFRIQRLAAGHGFHGPAYDDTGSVAAQIVHFVSPFGVSPNPAAQFHIAAGQAHVLAILFSFAATGAEQSALIDPDGNRYTALAADAGGNAIYDDSNIYLAPGTEGDWKFATGGAAAFAAGGGLIAYSIVERTLNV